MLFSLFGEFSPNCSKTNKSRSQKQEGGGYRYDTLRTPIYINCSNEPDAPTNQPVVACGFKTQAPVSPDSRNPEYAGSVTTG